MYCYRKINVYFSLKTHAEGFKISIYIKEFDRLHQTRRQHNRI